MNKPTGSLDFDGVTYLWTRIKKLLLRYVKKTDLSTVDVTQTDEGATVTITSADGEKTVQIKNGEKGDTGPQGERGPQGEQGPKGPAGVTFKLAGTVLTITTT